jgi:polyadenylate-binding protein 2
MKNKLKEMEEEAARLREMQGAEASGAAAAGAAAGGAAGAGPSSAAAAGGPTPMDAAAADAEREAADARSVYVGNVDYGAAPEELQQLFASCGTVNRVTILADKQGQPKGFAYVEFLETAAVDNAILLDGSELRGRGIKVNRKRTNVPGLKARGRGGAGGGGRGRGGGGGMMMVPGGRGGAMMMVPGGAFHPAAAAAAMMMMPGGAAGFFAPGAYAPYAPYGMAPRGRGRGRGRGGGRGRGRGEGSAGGAGGEGGGGGGGGAGAGGGTAKVEAAPS